MGFQTLLNIECLIEMDRKPNDLKGTYNIECKKIKFNACSINEDLEYAKQVYSHYKYIGSSNVIYINGIRNEFKNLYHFFI